MTERKLTGKQLGDLVNLAWRLTIRNCQDRSLGHAICLDLLGKSLADCSPAEIHEAMLEYKEENRLFATIEVPKEAMEVEDSDLDVER